MRASVPPQQHHRFAADANRSRERSPGVSLMRRSNSRDPKVMTKTLIATRSLLLAGALAFAALPVLAQTAPSTQPAAPAAGSTVSTPNSAPTGKSTTGTKSHLHSKKLASHAKSKVHAASAKKPMDTKAQKP